jgi:hypothetical protein
MASLVRSSAPAHRQLGIVSRLASLTVAFAALSIQ